MHTAWHDFLKQQGANFTRNHINDFGRPEHEKSQVFNDVITNLSHVCVIKISGNDAQNFLAGQFTNDVKNLSNNMGQPGAWCNIKGRIIVNFLLLNQDGVFYLILASELKEIFIKRLQMYVLRADVVIDDMSDELIVCGLRGKKSSQLLSMTTDNIPDKAYHITNNNMMLMMVPDDIPRFIILAKFSEMQRLWSALTPESIAIGSHYWQLFDMLSGLAWIDGDTSEHYLPQELNMDRTGGLSFDKGCYPGQEIIARLHYRGQENKRLYLACLSSDNNYNSGTKLYTDNLENHIGSVVNISRHPDGRLILLVVMDKTIDKENIHIGSPNDNLITITSTDIDS